MKQAIFLHGLFRSGSTYFFEKFRANTNFWCYYEPFHHVISNLDQENIDIWKLSSKKSKRMNHPILNRPHFFEYLRCFDEGRVKYFDKRIPYDRFLEDSQADFKLEKEYVDHLIKSTPTNLIPVLQFNRSSLRLESFLKEYPDSHHYYLLRNPRQQFQSYVNSGIIFLSINLIIASRLERDLNIDLGNVKFYENPYINNEITIYNYQVAKINLLNHYRIFLYIWFKSYLKVIDSGCKIIYVDRETPDTLKATFHNDLYSDIAFDDFNMPSSLEFLLTRKKTLQVEQEILERFDDNSLNVDVIEFYNSTISEQLPKFSFKLRSNYYRNVSKGLMIQLLYRFKFRIYLRLKAKLKAYLNVIKKTICYCS